MPDHLIAPHGRKLVNLIVDPSRAAELKEASRDWASWDLTPRQLCDLELLMNGGFSPLTGFLTRKDYDRVVKEMRLGDGTLWPMPVTLDVRREKSDGLEPGSQLALRDAEGVMLAAMHVEDVWEPDLKAEAQAVFGTTNPEHPGVAFLLKQSGTVYVGGKVEGIHPPGTLPLPLPPAGARRGAGRVR